MPSAVFAAEEGRLVVGREAERRARLDPARFEPNPKRRVDEGTLLLGDRVVPVTEAFAAVLGKVAGEVSRQLNGGRADEVRLTHPAQWGPVRRNVLLSAARQAGLGSNLVLVPEPVAAAAHFASFPGRSLAPGQALAVYDLGAGTFDVAIVVAGPAGFTVLAEAGLPDLGGLDVDQSLLAHVGHQVSVRDPAGWQRLLRPQSTADRRARRALQEDVRAAKEALSVHPQTEVPLPEPFHDALVTRAELEALIRPNLLRSVELLSATVRSAGLTQDRLAGVYLVGGSSRIPLVATLIAEQLRIVATNLDQPETAVALGAHHVAREAVSPRTDGLPPADEERTTHIASPPRPVAAPRPPATAAHPVPLPRFAGPPSIPPPASPGPRGKRKLWLILVPVVVVVLAAAAWGIPLLTRHSPQGPTVAVPVEIPEQVDCGEVLTHDEIYTAVGIDGEITTDESAEPVEDGAWSRQLCSWIASGLSPRHEPFSVYLYTGRWVPPNDEYDESTGAKSEKYTLEGNDAYQEDNLGRCTANVAVGKDGDHDVELYVAVDNNNDDHCDAARNLLETAFSRLSTS